MLFSAHLVKDVSHEFTGPEKCGWLTIKASVPWITDWGTWGEDGVFEGRTGDGERGARVELKKDATHT